MTGKVTVKDIEMRYARFGHGEENFIIIPGVYLGNIMDSAGTVEASFSTFRDKYTVYLFARRDNMPDNYLISDMAEDTYLAMRELGIGKADIYGSSQGGMISQEIAINHPDFVGKLILASTDSKITDHFYKICSNWIRLAEQGEKKKLAGDLVDLVFGEATLEKIRPQLIRIFGNTSDEANERFLKMSRGFCPFDTTSRLKEIKAETLVICAEGDKIFTVDASREIAEKTGAELYVYGREYGHAVYDEAPDVKKRMFEFLNKEI